MASGRGRNLQAIQHTIEQGGLDATIVGVFSNRRRAPALAFAADRGLHHFALKPKRFHDRAAFDVALAEAVAAVDPDWVILAGYMRILTPKFIDRFSGRLVNIHPSLLPAYKGLDTHARALAAGETVHGASVHIVTDELDAGPVIRQGYIHTADDDTPETLGERVMSRVEQQIYPAALAELSSGRVVYRDGGIIRDGQPQKEAPNDCYDAD